ncbi:MAG: hypothetical protein K0S01_108 [Herbinix sp.]|jgi:hypothetical protein|nr:hypothetical protein [Herbinix sp.]
MSKLIKLELLKLRNILITFFLFSIILSGSLVLIFLHGYSYQYNIEIWSEAYTLILFLFPIFCTVPTTWLLYYERKNNFIAYSVVRTRPRKYFLSKLFVHCSYGFIITFLMSMEILLISLYAVGKVSGPSNPISAFQLETFINQPLLYGLALSLWRGLLSILFVVMGFIISLIFNNIFVIMILPFIYYIIENILLSMLRLPYFRILTALGLASGDYTSNIELWYLFIGPGILGFFTFVLFLIAWNKKVFFNK